MKKVGTKYLVIGVIILITFGLGIRLGETNQLNKPIALAKWVGTGNQIRQASVECSTNGKGLYSCDDLVKDNNQTLVSSCDSYYQGLSTKNNTRPTSNTSFCSSFPNFVGGFDVVCR